MKRIHNNPILTKSKAIRYTYVLNKLIKGTKRKANLMDLDEALKRSTTLLAEIS